MSKFSEFLSEQQVAPVEKPSEILDGSFNCQVCGVYVDEAKYFRSDSVLKWVCPEGHPSYIEDFRI